MKKRLNLTVDREVLSSFKECHGGSISSFLEEKMAEYINLMRLRWWLICPKCRKTSHIRIVLENGGLCQYEDCKERIAEKLTKPTT